MEESERKSAAGGLLWLSADGMTAGAGGETEVVRLKKEDAAELGGVETLLLPDSVREFYGLELFENLRAVRYDGQADVFGFQDTLQWLTEKRGNSEKFLGRVATNMLAFRPAAPTLASVTAPRMRPPHASPDWATLLEMLEAEICPDYAFYRQDDARQNIFLCRSYVRLKRMEFALYFGLAVSGERYAPAAAEFYRPEERFTPEEQILYALAHQQGHSYEAFYTSSGEYGYTHMKTKAAYMEYLRRVPVWEDTPELRRQLSAMRRLGWLTAENVPAAVDMAAAAGAAEAAAFLLNEGERLRTQMAPQAEKGADFGFLDAEFHL